MSRRVAVLAARVRRLADALVGLRERVRIAVASELGRAVGDAVRDLVDALARGPGSVPIQSSREWEAEDPWDNEGRSPTPHPWDDEDLSPPRPHNMESPGPPVSRLAGAVAAAAAIARWWVARPLIPAWAGATLTALAGAAAWCGGPLAHAALAALAAAADLLATGRPTLRNP